MRAVFLDFDTVSAGDIDTVALDQALPGIRYFGASTAAQLPERIAGAEVVLINKIRMNKQVFNQAPALRLVCAAATGTDNIDLGAAQARGIAVCNIRDYCTASVVQHVFALLLGLNHHLEAYGKLLSAGAWSNPSRACMLDYPIAELAGRKLGIVGYGTLGQAVARVAGAFGLEVLVAQRLSNPPAPGRVPLPELLREVDVLSLHCPLTELTHHMINRETLAQMKPTAILINTGRGGLVDAVALAGALRRGELGGAGIDVLENEPPVDGDPLLDSGIPNLIVTPHIAWAAREARQRAVDEMAANAVAFAAGETRNRVI